MKRFFLIWLACWVVNLLATLAISVGWYRHVDLRFETFAANQIVPALQAAVLGWLLSRPDWRAGVVHLRAALRHPLAQIVLLLDVAVIGASLYAHDHPLIGIARESPGPPVWLATKLGAAGLALLVCAWRTGWRPWSWVATALVLIGLAVETSWRWDEALVSLAWPGLPTAWRWLLLDIPAFCVIVWLVLRAADDAPPNVPARAWMSAALVIFGVVAVIAGVSWFLRPFFVEPWGTLARVAASISASCLLVAALTSLPYADGS
jgi:hypothetical protein